MNRHRYHDPTAERQARLLGWASLGLGAAQLTAPRVVCRLAGVDDSTTARNAVPLVGVRELAHAVLLLGSDRPAPLVWTRVLGDAVDLAALGSAIATRRGGRRVRAATVTAAVAAIAAADVYTASRALRHKPSARDGAAGKEKAPMEVHASITVNRPRSEVYRYWHDVTNLPTFMTHLDSVEYDDGHTHWKARGPMKRTVEWDAEVVEDRPDELIAWRSTAGGGVDNAGTVRFSDAPGDRGTELHVDLSYRPPAGKAGAAVAKLFGEHPEQQVRDGLRRFKQVLETGEVVRSEGSPEGTHAMRQARQRPAQPLQR
ncbi:SRPBCC family protein [Streptomyces sp. NPDC093595]|uniref:SRPBCC family protein n=1 Tax=Streptomyces sp. NPDC093595 TaxID=3366045 RepID=UPI0037F33A65